ncbi:MAG: TetR/AcrR family transcriptional regulator [Gemmatimonadetes bacterium]|nr:TetR/AcrR family transcriptional regulator [Gemmatimonadota bacterium]
MPRSKEATKKAILDATETLLRRRGAPALTLEAVAHEAGCAKGLVNYHFRTKGQLLVEAVQRIAAERDAAWVQAFDSPNPQDAIDRTWDVLKREAQSGTLKAWTSLGALSDKEVDQTVNNAAQEFRTKLTEATEQLLERAGMKPSIPPEHLGWLMAAIVQGMAFQVVAGGDMEVLENAYAAAWLGLLSLTEPID